MAGALLLLAATAAAGVVAKPNAAAWRGLAFVLLTGSSSVLMSGWPEHLLGIEVNTSLLPAKAALGPLTGALALAYLGLWLGIVVEDRLIRVTVAGGSIFLVVTGMLVLLWAATDTKRSAQEILAVSALINFLSCIFASLVAVRGAVLGDPLARRMAFACMCLTGMVLGLYAKGLGVRGIGHIAWALTAICCVAYFLIVTMLTLQRNKARLRLEQLARGQQANDAVTGLPTGVELLVQVDDALWRSERVKRQAMVIAVWVANLYELSGLAGQTVDLEIRTSLAARLRRAVGFRNVVGQYHPRCFVVVVSAVQSERVMYRAVDRLRAHVLQPMLVGALSHNDMNYRPHVGLGIVMVEGTAAQPNQILDQAEQLAQSALRFPSRAAVRRAGETGFQSLDEHDLQNISRLRERSGSYMTELPDTQR